MKNKDKKMLLNIIALAAVGFSIAQIFFPVFSINTFDTEFMKDFDRGFKIENYIFMDRYHIYENNLGVKTLVGINDVILHIYFQREIPLVDRNNPNSVQQSSLIIPLAIGTLSIFGVLSIFLFFTYKALKFCGKKKTRYFLYSGITFFIFIISFLIGSIVPLYLYSYDLSTIKFGYAFYYMLIALCLFFISYYIQANYIDYEEDKPAIEKVLFDKYKKE